VLIAAVILASGPADGALAVEGGTTCELLDGDELRCWGEHPRRERLPAQLRGRLLVRGESRCVVSATDELVCHAGGQPRAPRSFGAVRDAALTAKGTACYVTGDGQLACAPDWEDAPEATEILLTGPSDAVAVTVAGERFDSILCSVHARGELVCRIEGCGDRLWESSIQEVVEAEGSGGADHVCARTRSGAIACETFEVEVCVLETRGEPVKIAALVGDTLDIAVGAGLGCARHADGRVSCWNLNPGAPDFARAREIRGVAGAEDLIVGDQHACVRARTGEVLCWGARDRHQLDDRERFDELDEPTFVAGIQDATTLLGTSDDTCALLTDGRVACWGRRQRPDGIPAWDSAPELRDDPERAHELVPLGDAGMCALHASGSVACWGAHAPADLPDISAVRLVGSADSVNPMVCLQPGRGEAVCAGSHFFNWREFQPYRFRVAPFMAAQVEIHADDLYRLDPSGSLRVETMLWRRDGAAPAFGAVETHEFPPGSSMACSPYHCCVLDILGRVTCHGGLDGRLLGLSNASPHARVRRELPRTFQVGEHAEALAVGSAHACVLRTDGRVACWGSNTHFQLGQGSESDASQEPLVVPGIEDATFVGAWYDRTCVVHRGGHVSCWGENRSGAAGAGDGSPAEDAVRVSPIAADAA